MNKKQKETIEAQMQIVSTALTNLRLKVKSVSDEVDTLYMFVHYSDETKKVKR